MSIMDLINEFDDENKKRKEKQQALKEQQTAEKQKFKEDFEALRKSVIVPFINSLASEINNNYSNKESNVKATVGQDIQKVVYDNTHATTSITIKGLYNRVFQFDIVASDSTNYVVIKAKHKSIQGNNVASADINIKLDEVSPEMLNTCMKDYMKSTVNIV